MVYYAYMYGFVKKIVPSHILCLCASIAICVSAGLLFYAAENRITKSVLSFIASCTVRQVSRR